MEKELTDQELNNGLEAVVKGLMITSVIDAARRGGNKLNEFAKKHKEDQGDQACKFVAELADEVVADIRSQITAYDEAVAKVQRRNEERLTKAGTT